MGAARRAVKWIALRLMVMRMGSERASMGVIGNCTRNRNRPGTRLPAFSTSRTYGIRLKHSIAFQLGFAATKNEVSKYLVLR